MQSTNVQINIQCCSTNIGCASIHIVETLFHIPNRQRPSEAEVDLNRSLMELSFNNDDDEPKVKCSCKGMCKRACPCVKESVKCGSDCKCRKNKCANQMEEVCTTYQNSKTK